MTPAPFHLLPGDAPAPAQAFWAQADDGVKLRLAHWPAAGDRDAAMAAVLRLRNLLADAG